MQPSNLRNSLLYSPRDERDNCGFGLIADMAGKASHELLATALTALANLSHRGAIGADGKTGDGCGILMAMPEAFFRQYAGQAQLHLTPQFAVGMVFLPTDFEAAKHCRDELTKQLRQELLTVAGWREVPTDPSVLGQIASASLPRIEQVLINSPAGWSKHDLERRLFMARRRTEKALAGNKAFYICSLSGLVIVYKALAMPVDLTTFYPDLKDPRLTTSIALFHQRFSTNTTPQWRLAQPFRFLAHNGEINTISGNRAWARARGPKFITPLIPDLQTAAPFVSEDGSDSMSLDNMLEVCLAGGMDIYRALRLLVPPAWENRDDMDPDLRAFYEFNAGHMEPWDGPAGIVMTTGRHVACTLDRNGLRPARYVITDNGWLTLSSEVGVWDYAPESVIEKGRVGPGEMLALDTETGELWRSGAIDLLLKERHPYKHWLEQHSHTVNIPNEDVLGEPVLNKTQLKIWQKLFGISREEREQVLRVLAEQGQEAIGSMGDDTPLAVLSQQSRSIFDYFRQQFAQVTNPPIDPLRESYVMTLNTRLGSEHNVFAEATGEAQRYVLHSPILSHGVFRFLTSATRAKGRVLSLTAALDEPLDVAIDRLVTTAVDAVRSGTVMLVLSDREQHAEFYPIPAVLACGAIHQRLIQEGLRVDANLIVETASARDPHQFAVLIGCGATSVYPWLAYAVITDLAAEGESEKALTKYRKGIEKGLLKILSKMGISAIQSYRGAQLFEAIGLHAEVVERCFPEVACRIQGATYADLQADILRLHKQAWDERVSLNLGGLLKFQHGGEYHAWSPDVVQTLQQAVSTGDTELYQRYAALVNTRPVAMLRDLLQVRDEIAAKPVTAKQLEAVQDEAGILRQFDSAGMSIGALSPEAHETLALAMNRIGGRSNSGEGGEDPKRYGTERVSKIKQIASGRFGVTPAYLMSAEVLQIKIAQGAKPGEGGQLPGDKVSAEIAALRHATPGITLISPPPHHDIYSIEDLAQLIFDLKSINPKALVSVKLVAEAGIGTIACGVVKCGADLITISGYDGGTGASPLTSVKYAGGPWELGLAEVQQALVANGLRDRVVLQVDGGFKTGLDVVKAAILGADSFGFGTAPMIAMGCKYLRICHLNNCATGVATQNLTLRKQHFVGTAEKVINFFRFVAQDTREWLARFGVSDLKSLQGRTDLLQIAEGQTDKQLHLDMKPVLAQIESPVVYAKPEVVAVQDLNSQIVNELKPLLDGSEPIRRHYRIRNRDRSVSAALAGELASRYGDAGSPLPIQLQFRGNAGQSFGVWNAAGVELHLIGDANDYVGKGMAGGRLIIQPPDNSRFIAEQTPIMGNTCLYGATGGELFARGRAGERFAVRNSGAVAVIEGCGAHGCEYMTGGVVVVLGRAGKNFAAGMSGGLAFVLDQDGDFHRRVNAELVEVIPLADVHMPGFSQYLRGLLETHAKYTGSRIGAALAREFGSAIRQFKVVKPRQFALQALLPTQHKAVKLEVVA